MGLFPRAERTQRNVVCFRVGSDRYQDVLRDTIHPTDRRTDTRSDSGTRCLPPALWEPLGPCAPTAIEFVPRKCHTLSTGVPSTTGFKPWLRLQADPEVNMVGSLTAVLASLLHPGVIVGGSVGVPLGFAICTRSMFSAECVRFGQL